VTTSLVSQGLPRAQASAEASSIAQDRSGDHAGAIPHFVQLDFAYAIRSVLYAMAIIMAAAAVIAFVGLRRGLQEESVLAPETA
jgi:hypothetical protein